MVNSTNGEILFRNEMLLLILITLPQAITFH